MLLLDFSGEIVPIAIDKRTEEDVTVSRNNTHGFSQYSVQQKKLPWEKRSFFILTGLTLQSAVYLHKWRMTKKVFLRGFFVTLQVQTIYSYTSRELLVWSSSHATPDNTLLLKTHNFSRSIHDFIVAKL